MTDKSNLFVLSLGGSLIAPKTGFDIAFLKSFKELILEEIKKGKRFIIVCGGGNTAREYQAAARGVGELEDEDIDWIGIHSTRLNAHFIRTIFRKVAHPIVVKNPTTKFEWTESVLIAAGWKPGWSTDYDAVKLAQNFGAGLVINLSNISYVFNKDPKEAGARKIEKMTWPELQEIVGTVWRPGANVPFDPIATKEASDSGLKLAFVKGTELSEVKKAILGQKFEGTVVE